MEISDEVLNARNTLGKSDVELEEIVRKYYIVNEISEWEYMQIDEARELIDKAWKILGKLHKEMYEFERKYL